MEVGFELEAVTPVFMRGADQSKVEIRAASIKGLMRWWFRALAGNYFGNNADELRKAESRIFGSTDYKAKFSIEIYCNAEPKSIYAGKFMAQEIYNLGYLWFPIKIQASRKQLCTYYPQGTRFNMILKSSDERVLNAALVSLWALVILGNIGFRSRRGAGSLKFNKHTDEFKKIGLQTSFNSKDELAESIENAISAIGEIIEREPIKIDDYPSYPILSPKSSYIGLYKKGEDPIDLLKAFQREYSNFRRSLRGRDRLKRLVFGAPIISFKVKDRRSSPMIVGVLPFGGQYSVKVLKFYTNPFSHNSFLNKHVEWGILKLFNQYLEEVRVWGDLSE